MTISSMPDVTNSPMTGSRPVSSGVTLTTWPGFRPMGSCAGKAIELTWGGLCRVPISELRPPRGDLTATQESAEGIVGHAVGKASEALQSRKAEQQIGRAGNDGRRPERLGVASRTGNS